MSLRNVIIGQLLSEAVARAPDSVAMRYLGRTVTYAELDRMTDAPELPQERLVFIPTTSTERPAHEVAQSVILYLAAMKRGKIAVFGARGASVSGLPNDLSDSEAILFTSGTTGEPKAVLSTHFARVNSAAAHVKALDASSDDRFLMAIPLHHCFSLTANLVSALSVGASLSIPDDRHTRQLLECIERDHCTIFNAVPTVFSSVLARSDLASYDLSSLRTGFIGGAAYTPEFFREVDKRLGFTLIPGLGQTEGTAAYTFLPPNSPLSQRSETAGRFMEHIEGKIESNGEICIRGFCVCQVLGEPPPPDGWLHTGDLGYLDPDGCIHTVGRLDDIIIRGGENIAPAELERLIRSLFPSVTEVAVVGVPDVHFGEELLACIAPIDAMPESELRAQLARHTARFKIPRYVRFYEQLPKNSTGKILRRELIKDAKQRDA